MSWRISRDLFALGVVAAMVVLTVVFGPMLPEQVPSHFDLHGNVNAYTARTEFIILMIGLTVGLYVVLTFIPFIDPFWIRIRPRYRALMIFRDITLGFILVMFVMTLASANQGHIPLNMLGIALGILFALIGNFLPAIPRNWFFGIRTPWTLTSDVVWQKSHVLGGWMFFVGGVVTALLSAFGVGLEYVLLPVLVIATVVSGFIYPFLLGRRLEHSKEIEHGVPHD